MSQPSEGRPETEDLRPDPLTGTGWGMRAFHAIALGCIPVIIQDDGSGRYPSVLQAMEGLLLDWRAFRSV